MSFDPPSPSHQTKSQVLKKSICQIEQKIFTLALASNDRGKFLRITEFHNGYKNTIAIPETGFEQFRKLIADITT